MDVSSRNCSWTEQAALGNPVGCWFWKLEKLSVESNHHETVAPTRPSCDFTCGVMFEAQRGGDTFIDFAEAAAIDADMRGRASRA
jgi:hypothetical protein